MVIKTLILFHEYKVSYLGLQVFICVKDTDEWISAHFVQDGAWEPDNVNNVIRAMKAYPSAVFIDIGANIGMYTLVIAALKRNVIAVDAAPFHLAYIKQSSEISKTRKYIELIYNSIRCIIPHQSL